jgi:hypothetical protein
MNQHDIITDRRLKLSFDDETGSILVSTPYGNQVELNDTTKIIKLSDQHGNVIEMSKDGISIFSFKDVQIKGLNISIEAANNIHIKATGEIESKATNIKEEAEMAFTARGNVKAELSSSAQTIVKGSIVMIN